MSALSSPGLDVSTIEHLDFEPTIPCEHSQHGRYHADEPAMFLVRRHQCPRCGGHSITYAVCLSGWEEMAQGVQCGPRGRGGCGFAAPRDERLTILRVIGGPR